MQLVILIAHIFRVFFDAIVPSKSSEMARKNRLELGLTLDFSAKSEKVEDSDFVHLMYFMVLKIEGSHSGVPE